MIPRSSAFPLAVVLGFMLLTSITHPAAAAAPRTSRPTPDRVADFDADRRIDVNAINMWDTNYGTFANDVQNSGNAGLIWPRGTAKTVIYQAGLWLGAHVGGEVRLALAEYASEFGPGAMVGPNSDIHEFSSYRVYKVRRWTGDSADTAHVDRSPAELAADPRLDPLAHDSWGAYLQGAAPYGAPVRLWRLPNPATPEPDDSLDVPGPDVRGDQMLWSVCNDADPSLHANNDGHTAPLGVEVHRSTFAFDRGDPLQQTVFLEFRIVNRGFNTLDDAYATLWVDADLGSAVDDLAGCDVGRDLGFAYNGQNSDAVYGVSPPAVGVVLLHGPSVSGTPLRMTSFVKIVNGTDPTSAVESYNLMQGLNRDGTPIINPVSSLPTHFVHDGDPVAGTGWLDTTPSDKRFLISCGPFHMAPGDSQVVIAAIVVGQGNDRLASISNLECGADLARDAYQRGFVPVFSSPCPVGPLNCPKPAAFWQNECEADGVHLTHAQLTQIAQRVGQRVTLFDWAPGSELSQFCAAFAQHADSRQQATREFAALLANSVAGDLGIQLDIGQHLLLAPLTPVACDGLSGHVIAELADSARSGFALADAVYLDDNAAHPPGLAGVDAGAPPANFGGGALYARDLFGSTLDPSTQPDSFTTVELHFSSTVTQKAYRYLRNEQIDQTAPSAGRGYRYAGFHDVPFTAWDAVTHQQLDVCFVERQVTDINSVPLPAAQQPATLDSTWGPDDSGTGGREYLFILRTPYSDTPKSAYTFDGSVVAGIQPQLYALWSRKPASDAVIDDGDRFRFDWAPAPSGSVDSLMMALASRPLSDADVAQGYQAVIACLGAINAGIGIGPVCDETTAILASLANADADAQRVALRWYAPGVSNALVERASGRESWTAIGAVSADGAGYLEYADRAITPGGRYGYRLAIVTPTGLAHLAETWLTVPVTHHLALAGFRPNPPASELQVAFTLPSAASARLELLDVQGRRVRERTLTGLEPGAHVTTLGQTRSLAPGIYLLRLTQSNQSVTRKAVLIR